MRFLDYLNFRLPSRDARRWNYSPSVQLPLTSERSQGNDYRLGNVRGTRCRGREGSTVGRGTRGEAVDRVREHVASSLASGWNPAFFYLVPLNQIVSLPLEPHCVPDCPSIK